jgi:CBS domain-containing protein
MSQLRVRDLMTTQVITVKPTDSVRHAVIKMAIDNVAGAPVTDNRSHVLGMVSQTDVLKLILKYQQKLDSGTGGETLLNHPLDNMEGEGDVLESISEEIASMTVEQIMVRTVISTTPDAHLIEVLKAMMAADIGRLPVLEQGVLVGTISRSDIIFALYKKKV